MSDTARLAPRSMGLAWQYGWLLLAALLTSHLIAMLLLQRTGALIHPISREQAIAALTTAHALTTHTHAGMAHNAPLPALQASPSTQVWLGASPSVAPFAMQPEELRLAADLRSRLNLPASTMVWMQLERTSGEHARTSLLSLAAWEPLRLRSSLSLPAQGSDPPRWLNADLGLQGRYDWSSTLLYTLPASIVPVLAAALWLAWRLVRPMRELIRATARVEYGREQPALPLHGPQEARELTRQFNAMQTRIALHRSARTRLLAAISHDLRTPVTELRLQSELVDDPALRDGLLASVAELEALVASTLDFARADTHAERTQSTDIGALLRDLAQRYVRQGHAVTVHHAASSPLHWPCQPLALRRALGNLIENALHHAGTPVRVEAAIESAKHVPPTLTIQVLDDGPGIAPEQLEQVLEPFHQLNSARSPDRPGVGLGLSIARACVQAQGGTLTLSNHPHGGLCATVQLPA